MTVTISRPPPQEANYMQNPDGHVQDNYAGTNVDLRVSMYHQSEGENGQTNVDSGNQSMKK